MVSFERRRAPWPWLAALAIVATAAVGLWLNLPRVVGSSPQAGLQSADSNSRISLTFNREMDEGSVESHLSIDPSVPGTFRWQGMTLTFTPSQGWPPSTRVNVTLSAGARSRLYLPLLGSAHWTFIVGAPQVVYLFQAGGTAELYAQTLTASQGTQLTDWPAGVVDFDVAPTATKIVYLANGADGTRVIHWLDPGTQKDDSVATCPGTERCQRVRASADGRWTTVEAVPAGGQATSPQRDQVWLVGLPGGQDIRQLGDPTHDLRGALWGPDGKLAVYDATDQVTLVFGAGPNFNVLARLPNKLGESGAWSPDGKYLLFPEITFKSSPTQGTETPEPSGQPSYFSHLKRFELGTDLISDLSGETGGLIEDATPSYSPNGVWIAFGRRFLDPKDWTLGRQIWVMRSDGSDVHQLTFNGDFNYSGFQWSADSKEFVYVRSDQTDPTRAPELGWVDMTTGQAQSLVVGGYAPEWMP